LKVKSRLKANLNSFGRLLATGQWPVRQPGSILSKESAAILHKLVFWLVEKKTSFGTAAFAAEPKPPSWIIV